MNVWPGSPRGERRDVPLLAACDVFVLPKRIEGLPAPYGGGGAGLPWSHPVGARARQSPT